MKRVPALIPIASVLGFGALFGVATFGLSFLPVRVAISLAILLGVAADDLWHQFCATRFAR